MKNHSGFTEYCKIFHTRFLQPSNFPTRFSSAKPRLGNQLTTEPALKNTTSVQQQFTQPLLVEYNKTSKEINKERKKVAQHNGRKFTQAQRPSQEFAQQASSIFITIKRKTKPTCDNIPALHVYLFNYFLLYTKSFLLKPSRLPETNNELPACQSRTTNPATTSDEAITLLSLTFQSTELLPRPHGRTPLWQKVGRTSIALVQSYHQRYHAEHCRNTNQMALLP